MILVMSICKEKLHELEFVKPIEDILRKSNKKFITRHYKKLKEGDINNSDRIIICGTSLKDNDFVKDFNYFLWIRDIISSKKKQKLLGICGGIQIISIIADSNRQVKELDIKGNFNHVLNRKTEIGFYKEVFEKEFLGIKGEQEVYHLHNYYANFSKLKDFEILSKSDIPQAIKHKDKEIYGVLFHPEVRNKNIIENFIKLE